MKIKFINSDKKCLDKKHLDKTLRDFKKLTDAYLLYSNQFLDENLLNINCMNCVSCNVSHYIVYGTIGYNVPKRKFICTITACEDKLQENLSSYFISENYCCYFETYKELKKSFKAITKLYIKSKEEGCEYYG